MSQSTFRITLGQIVDDYGIEILKDGKRVIAIFSDYRPDCRVEKNKLRIAYEFDVVGLLTKAPRNTIDISIACNKAIKMLKEQAFIDSCVASSIVCDIADVLKLEYSLPMQREAEGKLSEETLKATPVLKDNATKQELHSDCTSESKTSRHKMIDPVWTAGSGVGYSTHNNPVFPYQVYDDLESQQKIDLTLSYKIAHPLKSLLSALRMSSKYRIACEWEKAQMYCNIYDAYVLDGAGHSLSAMKYKKYNEKHIKKLERKFWS